jgi:hypothetical protein
MKICFALKVSFVLSSTPENNEGMETNLQWKKETEQKTGKEVVGQENQSCDEIAL